jgi:nucleotide-binding universal stress UspA family protein
MINEILVPVDGSDHSMRAADFAGRLASRFGASVTLLHVFTRLPARAQLRRYLESLETGDCPDEEEITAIRDVLAGSGEDEARDLLAKARAAVQQQGVESVNTAMADGDPAAMIIETVDAARIDMIVMGRRGLGGVKGLLMGSVSYRVLHAAACPVVSVR